jgi:hypothetical protein
MMLPRPVYFTHADKRLPGQTLVENDPTYGKVWHLQSADDVMTMINRENGLIWTAHPQTKTSEGYPDAYKTKPFFLSDRFIGASFESLPVDLSQKRLCPVRCFDLEDKMSDWAPTPKYMIAESDTYQMEPEDSLYDQLAVNYLKLDHVPLYDQSWDPIIKNMREGNFFGTTGEILFHDWAVEGRGAERTYTATIEYTFPLQFAELVWSDGTHVGRKIISLTDTLPFGVKTFHIPFQAAGKKWVRFAVWDSAGNGAWVQPRALQ